MKKQILKLVAICIVIFIISFIIINRKYKITDIYPKFPSDISQLSIHYSDGVIITITDIETINKFTDCILEQDLKRYYFYDLRNEVRVGVGYGIDFYDGNNNNISISFKEPEVLSINGKLYSISNTDLYELMDSAYKK